MPQLTISDAARVAGVDRRTLQRQIKRGILSAVTAADGQKRIDLAELARVYPDLQPQGQPQTLPHIGTQAVADAAELAAVRRELDRVRQQLEEVRQDRDHWRRTAQQLLPGPRRGWLERLADLVRWR
jgi:hypothetical protein